MSRLAVCFLAAAATAQAATTVYQASFDQPNHPWATVHSAASPDAAIHHGAGKRYRTQRLGAQ